jgi:hypothetical protein
MKLSSATVEKLRVEWDGVVQMRTRMESIVMGTFAGGSPLSGFSSLAGFAVRDIVYNLPLLLAFDVLKQVLAKARDESLFVCSRNQLGDLMESGKDFLPWIDWDALREGVRRRNAVAHDGELFDGKQCLKDIGSVEAQLVAWNIIDAA